MVYFKIAAIVAMFGIAFTLGALKDEIGSELHGLVTVECEV